VPALVLALVVAACGGGEPVARTGEPAPPIVGTALDGTTLDLAAYRGKPLVVNFWASWCTPCREEFPMFKEKLDALGPTDGLQVVGVLYEDQPELARAFLDDFGASWPSVADPDGAIAKAYRVVAPPQTYFIDKDGILRGIQIGEVRPEDFDTQYAKIAP
jgi:cytochrome c biogenesis protein CcmG, thiol:disulfide interchange protein DsbE